MSTLQFRVHQCKAGHFHLLTGYNEPSFPFWCLGTGLKLIELCREYMVDSSDPEATHEHKMLDGLKLEIERLAQTQLRDRKGRFEKGFLLPRTRPPLDEHGVAPWWGKFFNSEAGNVYVYSELLMRHVPLRCDFIDRPGDDKRLTLFQLEKLEAKPRTVRQLGIALEK